MFPLLTFVKRSFKNCILLILILCLWSCAKHSIDPQQPTVRTAQKLFLAGRVGTETIFKPAYWANDSLTVLSDAYGEVVDISFSDTTKIYAVGYLSSSTNKISLWNNGVHTYMPCTECNAQDIQVNNNDVYVAGQNSSDAAYWKNDAITSRKSEGLTSHIKQVAIVNNEVYATVQTLNNDVVSYTASYWTGSTNHTLSSNGQVSAMAVGGSDAYMLGALGKNSVIWKNGTIFSTFGGQTTSDGKTLTYYSTGLTLRDDDVFVSGIVSDNQSTAPCYWRISKSGNVYEGYPSLLPFATGLHYVYTNSIEAFGQDIYISGYQDEGGTQSLLWKNGELVAPFDGNANKNFFINRICVK